MSVYDTMAEFDAQGGVSSCVGRGKCGIISGMETKPMKEIMYGVTDFARMRNLKLPA